MSQENKKLSFNANFNQALEILLTAVLNGEGNTVCLFINAETPFEFTYEEDGFFDMFGDDECYSTEEIKSLLKSELKDIDGAHLVALANEWTELSISYIGDSVFELQV
jgi:hypothetical protein